MKTLKTTNILLIILILAMGSFTIFAAKNITGPIGGNSCAAKCYNQ